MPQTKTSRHRKLSETGHRRSFSLGRNQEQTHVLDKERQQRLSELSQELLIQFHTLIRMLNFHSRENEATQKVLLKLHDSIKQLFETEYELHVEFSGSDFIINDRWTRLPRQLQDLSGKLGQELREREVGGFWISVVPRPEAILQFVRMLLAIAPSTENAFSLLQNNLWNNNINWISLEKYVASFDWDGVNIDLRSYIRQIYFSAIQSVQQLYTQAQQGKTLKLKSAKRTIQAFVELFCSPRRKDEANFLRLLTNVKNCLGYSYNRSINIAVQAIGFGHYLGFPRHTLRDIGIAAMFFDIGMSQLPDALESKAERNEQEQKLFEAHTTLAVPIILNTTYVDTSVMRAVNVAFAHHLGHKGGGFPQYGHSVKSPLSKMLSLLDHYETLTSPRPEQTKLLSPPMALGELSVSSDPILTRKFISYMGVLPLGTLVQLNTQDIGYVIDQPSDPEQPMKPIVKILLSPRGNESRIVDIAQISASGNYNLQIVKLFDMGQYKVQQALLQDLLRG
jgi:HD-GYP domain-containing protein (c-di-GMP phosphodiesterase class II)